MIFHTPLNSTPPLVGPRRNIAIAFDMGKPEWWGYPTEKNFEDRCNRVDTIPACDRQTNGQTDILRQHSPRYAYPSRGRKTLSFFSWCCNTLKILRDDHMRTVRSKIRKNLVIFS